MKMPYKRILLKLSGEMLSGEDQTGLSDTACLKLAHALREIVKNGHELAVVIGGGNIFRGINLHALGMERTPADHMGMLATLMNGIAIREAVRNQGGKAHVMSALSCSAVVEDYNWNKAQEYLMQGEIVIFVGGTGSPYFTTDTAAALRSSEMKVDALLKATKVNGVYTEDPKKNPNAKRYEEIGYTQYLTEKLGVMDSTAVVLCMNNKIPIFVFNMEELGQMSINSLLSSGSKLGTFIK